MKVMHEQKILSPMLRDIEQQRWLVCRLRGFKRGCQTTAAHVHAILSAGVVRFSSCGAQVFRVAEFLFVTITLVSTVPQGHKDDGDDLAVVEALVVAVHITGDGCGDINTRTLLCVAIKCCCKHLCMC